MRWRQVYDKETGKSEFIPIDEAAARQDRLAGKSLSIVRGNFDAFVSPVDRSLISTQRDLDNHNMRHAVVNSAEFSPEFLEGKRKERERVLSGIHTRQEKFERKQEIYDKWVEAERNG